MLATPMLAVSIKQAVRYYVGESVGLCHTFFETFNVNIKLIFVFVIELISDPGHSLLGRPASFTNSRLMLA